MPIPEPSRPFDRILVALDASPHSQAALDVAVRMARGFEAELEGLFIKDENLLRAAQLSFTAEVRTHTRSPKELSDRRVERQLRYQAQRAEAALQDAAERAEVDHEFHVAEGHVTRELLKAAERADLLALGKTSTESSRRRLGTTSRALLSRASTPVLVLRKAVQQRQPVLTYYDGSDRAALALQMAVRLTTRVAAPPLKVLLPATGNPEELGEEVLRQYEDRVPDLQVRPLTQLELGRLALLAQQEGPGLVVLPAGCPLLEATPFQRFLYEIDRPLLLVR